MNEYIERLNDTKENLLSAIGSIELWYDVAEPMTNFRICLDPEGDIVYCSRPDGKWDDEYRPERDWSIYDVKNDDDAIDKALHHTAESIIKQLTIENGERDDVTYRYYLSNEFNNTIDYCGATDILCSHVGTDGMLTFLVSDYEDEMQYFIDAFEIPIDVLKKIIEKISE